MVYVVKDHPCYNESLPVCNFRLVNGSCLTAIGIVGFFLSSATVYILIAKIKLPNCQNVFILNVALVDVTIAFMGTNRGLGIINTYFVGAPTSNSTNVYCSIQVIMMNTFCNGGMIVLLPLTIDRFVAVMWPLRHKYIITTKRSVMMVCLTWLALFGLYLNDTITYKIGSTKVNFNKGYHRCVLDGRYSVIEQLLFLALPLLIILILYTFILAVFVRNKQKCGRLLMTSSLIIFTGVVAYFPTIVANLWNIKMDYYVSSVFTITLYYVNPILNPVIYLLTHPTAKRFISPTRAVSGQVEEDIL